MARSQYIWIVDWYGPIAAFTVKRELKEWLHRHPYEAQHANVWRADGPDQLVRIPIDNLRIKEG